MIFVRLSTAPATTRLEECGRSGRKAGNKNELYDMRGNVWQWCEDWYNSKNSFRVLRGASWYDYDPYRLLASYRRSHTPDRRGADAGFRCVVARESSP